VYSSVEVRLLFSTTLFLDICTVTPLNVDVIVLFVAVESEDLKINIPVVPAPK